MRINQKGRIFSKRFKSRIEVKKRGGEHSVNGFKVVFSEPKTIEGIVIPLSGDALQALPEEERYQTSIGVYSVEPLQEGDSVIFNGSEYKISKTEQWGLYGYCYSVAVRYSEVSHPNSRGFELT